MDNKIREQVKRIRNAKFGIRNANEYGLYDRTPDKKVFRLHDVKMSSNIIREKSFTFALSIIDTYKLLTHTYRDYVLSKQLLKSGTSVGANIEEALRAQSRRDFHAKMSIALKEAAESLYWLKLLQHTYPKEVSTWRQLVKEGDSIIAILVAITRSTKE